MSKGVSKNTLEDIRAANDIVEVVGTYLQLKRAGSGFRALCPFHKEKTPSFNVHPQKQIYHCFGCGAGGDVFRFVMEYEQVDFPTALRMLAQRAGIRIEWADRPQDGGPDKDLLFRIHDEVARIYHRALAEMKAAAPARAYLEERELDEKTVKEFMIGYAPDRRDALLRWGQKKSYAPDLLEAAGLVLKSDRGGHYDRFRGRVMFPIRDEIGRVIAFSGRLLSKDAKAAKYVNSPDTVLFHKGRVLFALDKARRPMNEAQSAILCEGQIDVIRCHMNGFPTAVATQGTALTEQHARLLKRYVDEVTVVLDADTAGQDASLRSAEALVGAGLSVRIAALPKGEDPDSLIRTRGAGAFAELVAGARSVLDFQIDVLRSREDLSGEAAMMRAVRAVLETISRAPTAVQRDQMVQQAARSFTISPEALRQDLARLAGRRPTGEKPAAPTLAPIQHPAEELALAELLVAHPELTDRVRRYVPLDQLTDPACRAIVASLLARPDAGDWNLVSELPDDEPEYQRLAAQIQMNPRSVRSVDRTPEEALQDVILVVRRKALERQRTDLRRRLEAAGPDERERLDLECKQLTLDIKTLQHGWERALPIIEL